MHRTVCLCMIVKNEVEVLAGCLESVKPLIDYWIIADTGSTDGTQELISNVMADVPGELRERPWQNFASNRNETIELAEDRFDYLLFIDADETLDRSPDFAWPELTADAYQLVKFRGHRSYRLPSLVKASLTWRFKGVVHEYLQSERPAQYRPLDGIAINSNLRGARARDPNTYKRDALLLEAALLDEPDNARYVYYLAQSYRDCDDLDLAIRHYDRRAAMGGWSEEAYNALYQAAWCRKNRGDPWPDVMAAFLKAYAFRPTRAEPLYVIANQLVLEKDYVTALIFLERALQLPIPESDVLFLETEIYAYHAAILAAVCYHYTGDLVRAVEINDALLKRCDIPPVVRSKIETNQKFSKQTMEFGRRPAA